MTPTISHFPPLGKKYKSSSGHDSYIFLALFVTLVSTGKHTVSLLCKVCIWQDLSTSVELLRPYNSLFCFNFIKQMKLGIYNMGAQNRSNESLITSLRQGLKIK